MSRIIHDNKHLSLNDRKIIEQGIENRCNKVDIARTLGKDPTTVAKEIRLHREFKPRNTFNYPNICINIKKCGGCKFKCKDYQEQTCKLRDRSPGACNKCPKMTSCHLDKYFYNAEKTDKEYRRDLVDFRQGINLTTKEAKELANILKPLLDKGQSLYQIKSTHKEIKQSIKTLYTYIEIGVFNEYGIDNFSLKEQVNRKQFNKKYKKRKEPVNYDGHKYEDFLKFKQENPSTPVTEMDTVLNSLSGPYIQTFEFEKSELFEFNMETGELRSNIFYCDPYKSSQKPHIENTHNYIRDIIPNEIDLTNLTQEDLDLMFSHINSTPRKIYNGKTPYEMFIFLHSTEDNPKRGKEILDKLNIKKIKRDEVVLKPYLIKHKLNK